MMIDTRRWALKFFLTTYYFGVRFIDGSVAASTGYCVALIFVSLVRFTQGSLVGLIDSVL